MREVSIIRCSDYDDARVYRAVKEAVDLVGGIEKFVRAGDVVLLKPNLLAGKSPEKGVTTHPSILRAALMLVKEAGGIAKVGDSSALGATEKNAEKAGFAEICKEFGAEFTELKTPVELKNPDAHLFKRMEVAKEALECDVIINLAKMKTHAQMYLTLSVKNLFGCVPGKRKLQWHLSAGIDTASFAAMLIDLTGYVKPGLNIIDGVVAMEGNGPASGELKEVGLVMASPDTLALDTVAATVLGAKLSDMPVLKKAKEIDPRLVDLQDIIVRGEAIESVRIIDFKFPPLVNIDFSSILPYFISKRVKKAMTSRPDIDAEFCALCNVCVSLCPADAMEMTRRVVIDYEECIRCYCCQESCPQGVISAKEGWLKRLIPGL
jgi:uncharacterized protein (DUF362 family)/Pyruvate/2-oxoacid:ferredoxin oxidoreductase delta subunit